MITTEETLHTIVSHWRYRINISALRRCHPLTNTTPFDGVYRPELDRCQSACWLSAAGVCPTELNLFRGSVPTQESEEKWMLSFSSCPKRRIHRLWTSNIYYCNTSDGGHKGFVNVSGLQYVRTRISRPSLSVVYRRCTTDLSGGLVVFENICWSIIPGRSY